MHKLLLVEDNNHKRERVLAFLRDAFGDFEIHVAASFTSACQSLLSNEFDTVLLDMSLPTYDKSPSESGGRFRTFGGREVARKAMRRRVSTRIIFLTQYPTFRDDYRSHTLQSLGEELRKECGDSYGGIIHYDSSMTSWKDELTRALAQIP